MNVHIYAYCKIDIIFNSNTKYSTKIYSYSEYDHTIAFCPIFFFKV